jgi:hypothetical protein
MTFRRRLALKIMRAVVRVAPPRAQDWALAILRELDLIESDWTALGWALGGVRIIFGPRDIPLLELSQIPRAAQKLAKTIRRRTVVGSAITLFESVSFGWLVFIVPDPMQRIGCWLVVAAMMYLFGQLFARRAREVPLETHSFVCASAYRAELERQRDFHRGLWFWSRLLVMLPGPLLFCAGGMAARPDRTRGFVSIAVVIIALCIIAVPLNLRMALKYQANINELDAVRSGP